MDENKVDMFLTSHASKFESHDIPGIRKALLEAPDEAFAQLQAVNFKNPTTMLIVSFLGGTLGIDRFMLGQMGMGIAKLLTCGGLSIWALVDLFLIMGATRQVNREAFYATIGWG